MSIRSMIRSTHLPFAIYDRSKMAKNSEENAIHDCILLYRVPIFHAAYSCMNAELDRLVPGPVSVSSREKPSSSTIEVSLGPAMIQIEYGVHESIPHRDEFIRRWLLGMTSSGSGLWMS